MDESRKIAPAGSRWRVLAHCGAEEVEMEDRGVFDELVVDDWLHVEKMDDDLWWLRIGDVRVMVTVAPGEAPTVDVLRAFYSTQRGTSGIHE